MRARPNYVPETREEKQSKTQKQGETQKRLQLAKAREVKVKDPESRSDHSNNSSRNGLLAIPIGIQAGIQPGGKQIGTLHHGEDTNTKRVLKRFLNAPIFGRGLNAPNFGCGLGT